MILKRYLGITGLFLCLFFKAQAQHQVDERHYPDSLTKLLNTAVSDTGKAVLFFSLSDYWSDKDSIKALQYARQGLQLSRGSNFYTGLGHFYLAGIYFDRNISRSQREYMLAEKLLHPYSSKQAFQFRSRAWHNFAALEQRRDNSKGYVDIILNRAIPLAFKAGDSIKVAADYIDIGLAFMNYKEYEKAIGYYREAIHTLHNSKHVYAELADCYTNTAKAYILNKNYQSAKPYLDSAFLILSVNPESTFLPAYYLVEGMYYNNTGKYKDALQSLGKGLKVAVKFNMAYDTNILLYERYRAFKGQKKYPEAKSILLDLYYAKKNVILSHDTQELLFELAQTDAALGNTKSAYQWLMRYSKLSDSIYAAKTQIGINELETKYKNSENEKKILKLKNDQNQVIQRQRYNKLFYFFVIVLLVLCCFFALIQLRNGKRLAMKNEAQYRNELERIQHEKRLITYAAIMEGQEQERQRLARDLHDGLGGLLAGVKMGMSKIIDKSNTNLAEHGQLKIVTAQLDGSVNELRRIARNLMPETLFKFGLIAALKDFCEGLNSEQTRIVFQSYGMDKQDIDGTSQIMIYRIVQELVTNVLKHAHAKNILVDCMRNNCLINITVEDDGIGFDPKDVSGSGIGLANIKARINFLRGELTIQSIQGKGTTINIEFTQNGKNTAHIPVNS